MAATERPMARCWVSLDGWETIMPRSMNGLPTWSGFISFPQSARSNLTVYLPRGIPTVPKRWRQLILLESAIVIWRAWPV